jgi:RecQ family ATP-dependent DNA helicase
MVAVLASCGRRSQISMPPAGGAHSLDDVTGQAELVTAQTRDRADELLGKLGFTSWRTGQKEAVEAALAGRDSLIVMPTGGGKSLCYQLPGLASEDLTIVVSPLIALINDQWRRLTAAGHPVAMITSAMSDEAVRHALAQVRGGEARIVYCSPERFGSTVFLEAIAQRRIDLLAVDEAHCVSEWGHDFRPDYLRLPAIAERLGRPTVMACTATATKPVAAEIASRFQMRDPLQVRSGFDRPNLSFDVVRLEGKGSKARRTALLEAGLADPENRPAIVYCGTRKDTDEVAETLRGSGQRAVAYHAGMEAEDRGEAQRRFMADEVDVVVATNAFGMGVDKADVRSVWHMAIPTSLEAYYQEAGRAGRDGRPAKAVLLAMRADLGRLVRFNQQRAGDPELAIAHERGWRDYKTIKSFIYSDRCRRRSVLDHFGDRAAGRPLERCCDACEPVGWLPDPETIVVRPARRANRSSAPSPELAPGDAPLFEELKGWRLRVAEGKPAFTVAHNSTLEAIAATRPGDPDALLEIRGVGPSFVSKYAAEVLEIIGAHPQPAP